ncbi:MAG: VapC toxin family PIN domain ribonuclease [Opitutia bacterium]|nr:PIN domain-containing protein [Opitutaceae bacterium]PHX86662.1 MAG: VapC toxin family PIN domain ribonuclease [Opitutae bacterium]
MILVDSCVYIRWLRDRADLFAELGDHLKRGELITCGVVRAEVLRGVVSVGARERMELLFAAMNEMSMGPAFWSEVADLAWELDRRGEVLPLTDIAIATCARKAGATVITTDPHFKKVPGLKVRSVV